jgi:hypothetical protein
MVTGDPVIWLDLVKLRYFGAASLVHLGMRAAWMKRASRRRSSWIGNVPTEDDALSLTVGIGYGNGRQQGCRVGMHGFPISVGCRSKLHESSEIHHYYAIGDMANNGEVVSNEQVCESVSLTQVSQQVQHLSLHRYVECRHGLVQDNELRFY